MNGRTEDAQRNITDSFLSLCNRQELFAKVIEFFPYPVQIFSADGVSRMINRSALELFGIKSAGDHVGKYNVFDDPLVRSLGATEKVRQVLTGRTVYITDFNAPYKDLIRYFNVEDRDIKTISSDITCFPLPGTDGETEYFAAVFIIKKLYYGKEEISRGREYIEANWQKPFDMDEVIKAACLSKSHFTRLFKKQTGMTPREYYISYRIEKLKELLLDPNLSVTQAFSICNVDYTGHSAKLFRERVGCTPSEFRKMSK